ncbi:uncharacterized protein LOC132701405 [Cylas formicarius]|uniref:uncharacterized protein LOC132701405 n=1 Tax=Cylas formicarius TaxID=197179 RepID=UPI0029584E74|nr:uncharacterized protein LOC132701405 [Cylas formicarius]
MGTSIETKPEIKYLGVFIDQGTTLKKHIVNTCKKAEASATALIRLMPKLDGPTSAKRRLLSTVTHSIMLYAAPSWSEDSVEHTFFICTRWQEQRNKAEQLIGNTLTTQNIVQLMLESDRTWSCVSELA